MDRWSISEFSTFRWSFQQDVNEYLAGGFKNIGVWNQKLTDYSTEQCEDLLFENQFGVSSYSWIGGFTGSDGVSHKDAIEQAIEDIRLAARVNAGTIIVYPGARQGHTRKHAMRLLSNALDELIPWAQDYGVRLALEPMHPDHNHQWSVLGDFDETVGFINQFDPRVLGMVLDLYHVGLDQHVFETLPGYSDRIALVQLSDRRAAHQPKYSGDQLRRPIGSGDVPICDWIMSLERIGYQGFYELEVFGKEMESIGYRERLAHTYDAIAKLTKQITAQSPSLEISNLRP